MRRLSKSKLIAFRQCPKRLWLELYKPELRDDSGSQAAFNIGYQVGDIALKIFDPEGTGINVDPNDIGWDASAAQTEAALQSGDAPVFEALLQIPSALALADIMLPDFSADELRWQMIEVKSSTSVKDGPKKGHVVMFAIERKIHSSTQDNHSGISARGALVARKQP